MVKNRRFVFVVCALLFVALIVAKHYAPKPIDWSMTFKLQSKSPYNCYILNDMFATLFPNKTIEKNIDGFYVALDSTKTEKKNIIVITTHFDPDKYDLTAMMKFVAKGNDVFISSINFGNRFQEKLMLEINTPTFDSLIFKSNFERFYFQNQTINSDSGYYFDKRMPNAFIEKFDSLNTFQLGTNKNGATNFVCVKHGMGKIFIHTHPLAFTNYHLISGNVQYAATVLSHLPIRTTVWDYYYKPDRFINDSPTRYILSQPALKAAFYLLLAALFIYLITESRRRQRVIPIVKPLENTSLQFVKTIGSLYFKQQNNVDLARKKSLFFKEFLREHYYLSNISSADESITAISNKSGVRKSEVEILILAIEYYENANQITNDGLIEFNKKIELFYKQCL